MSVQCKFLFTFLAAICIDIFCCFNSSAQNHNIDSLTQAIKKSSSDTVIVYDLSRLSYEYENLGSYPIADSLAREALKLGTKADYQHGIALAYTQIGSVAEDLGNYPKALDNFSKALSIRKMLKDRAGSASSLKRIATVYNEESEYSLALGYFLEAIKIYEDISDKHGSAIVHNDIGGVYTNQGNYPKALEEHFNALKVLEELKDTSNMIYAHQNIGNVYVYQNEYAKALDQYNNALSLSERKQDTANIANSLSNIGLIYSKSHDYTKALEKNFSALNIRTKHGDKNGIATSLINIGGIYYAQNDFNRALDYINKSLDIFTAIGNKDGVANCLDGLGQVYLVQKNYAKALEYENKSLELAKDIGSLDGIASAYLTMSRTTELMGNPVKALEYYKNYSTYQDSISNKESTKKTVQAEMNYNFEKKQAAEKAEQDKKDALQAEEVKKQKLATYSVSGILLLVIGFAVFAYRSNLQKKRANRELDIKNKKIEAAYTIIETKNHEITDSINYAQRIQQAILPGKKDIMQSLPDSFVLFKPKDIVSGDFYFFAKRNEIKFIAAVDCTGHGVPGAFMSLIGWEKLNDAVEQTQNVGEVLKVLNKGIKTSLHQSGEDNSTRDGMDIALCSLSSAPSGVILKYSGANRPLWIVKKDTREVLEIKATKRAIGGFSEEGQDFENHNATLQQGDSFYIFSDGYADQFGGEKKKKLTTKKFRELLVSVCHLAMPEQEKFLSDFIEDWKTGNEQIDDILVIGVRV
ncbi:MAG: tetratricopeptide repeat protein [Bacteroidia bacterium]